MPDYTLFKTLDEANAAHDVARQKYPDARLARMARGYVVEFKHGGLTYWMPEDPCSDTCPCRLAAARKAGLTLPERGGY